MSKVKDPVCGMMIERADAVGQARVGGQSYYFCSQECLRAFQADPGRYVTETERATGVAPLADLSEQHEPPYTKSGQVASPKFGSATSGGGEYEPLPEAHPDREA
jgi:Cu+-exporting ATPase